MDTSRRKSVMIDRSFSADAVDDAAAESNAPHLLPNPMLHVRECSDEKPGLAPAAANNLLVIKVGTSSLMCDESPTPAFSLSNMGRLVDSVVRIHNMGYQVVLVTSGAVGAGCLHMKLKSKPTTTVGKQAMSAIGQCRLMRVFEDLFDIREVKVAQLLITRTDFSDKLRFLNFKNTLLELISLDVIPIINENDSVACNQLKFGDNDTLAAFCAISLGAKWLFLLTDVDCLYTANPRTNPDAEPVPYVGRLDDVYKMLGGDCMGSSWGSGGMRTKIVAAKLASATGIKTALCHGKYPERIIPILKYYERIEDASTSPTPQQEGSGNSSLEIDDPSVRLGIGRGMEVGLVTVHNVTDLPYTGTVFAAHHVQQNIPDQRRWILSLPVRGKLFIDEGAAAAVIRQKKSLFAAGVVEVEGEFYEGEAVSLYMANRKMMENRVSGDQGQGQHGRRMLPPGGNASGRCMARDPSHPELATALQFDGISEAEAEMPELARCLINYSSDEISRLKGVKSSHFAKVLSFFGTPEMAHRSNIIFVNTLSLAE